MNCVSVWVAPSLCFSSTAFFFLIIMSTVIAPAAFDQTALESLCALDPPWVADRRRAAFERFQSLSLPDRSDENWMRTELRLFKRSAWGPSVQPGPEAVEHEGILARNTKSFSENFLSLEAELSEPMRLAGQIVTLNGHLRRSRCDQLVASRGVLFGTPEQVMAVAAESEIRPHWFNAIDSGADMFAAMHAAFHRGGAIVFIPDGVRLEQPLHLLSCLTEGGTDLGHVLVVLGKGAEATVITETAGGGPAGSGPGGLHCGGIELIVGENASLRMVNIQNWNTGVWHFARQKAKVHSGGKLQWTLAALGSRLSQVAQDVALVGVGAHAQVNGVMFTEGRQQLIYNTLQHHEAASCISDLLYKGALQDRSRLVWRGMIKVDKSAQKTNGYQRSDTLMLSEHARSDSIPGLEIEADDVRCTHGATSGRVDREQIFYAQCRGLSADEAARLVVAGFFQQVFDRITIAPVREALAEAISERIRRIQ